MSDRAPVDGEGAMSSLSPPHRTVILLTYFGGQTHSEVAATVGIAHDTATTRIRAALRALRAQLSAPTAA